MEYCQVCGCGLHRRGGYARPTTEGRSHASRHHYIPERFFGRTSNHRGVQRERLFDPSPWGLEGESATFCYDCHEELIHNPVLLPPDVSVLAELVRLRGLDEAVKTHGREKLAGRIQLLHEALSLGLQRLLESERQDRPPAAADQATRTTG